MMTKTITLLTLAGALAAAIAVSAPSAKQTHKKTPTVTITDVESYPAEDDDVDCELIVTPSAIKTIRSGASC